MILESANCTFGGVVAMVIRGVKLEVDILFVKGVLHSAGTFIVKDVVSGSCAELSEMFVARFPGVGDFEGLAVPQKVGVD